MYEVVAEAVSGTSYALIIAVMLISAPRLRGYITAHKSPQTACILSATMKSPHALALTAPARNFLSMKLYGG